MNKRQRKKCEQKDYQRKVKRLAHLVDISNELYGDKEANSGMNRALVEAWYKVYCTPAVHWRDAAHRVRELLRQ